MKFSITIPQIFYDLIARVVPGFLFLFMLGFELSGTGVELVPMWALLSNSIAAILTAIVYGVLSYLMGWVLRAFTFLSFEDKVKEEYERHSENVVAFSEMYHRIRIVNEAVGFRIVKLRAEARMLETSRTGMVFMFVITLGLTLLNELALLPMVSQSALGWGVKLGVPLIVAIAFRRCERRTWYNYYGNILKHYDILFGKGATGNREHHQGSRRPKNGIKPAAHGSD